MDLGMKWRLAYQWVRVSRVNGEGFIGRTIVRMDIMSGGYQFMMCLRGVYNVIMDLSSRTSRKDLHVDRRQLFNSGIV